MAESGTTVSLKLLIQATNNASKEVVKLQSQLNSLSQSALKLGADSAKGAKQGKQGIDEMETSTTKFMKSMKAAEEATKGFGTAGLSLLGLAASIGTATFFPVKAASDFQYAMSGVVAVTSGATENFEALKATASELGRTTKFTAREAAEGMQFLGQAGFEASQVIQGIGPSLQLATAAAVSLGEAANIATNVLSGMRLPVSDLQQVVDILAKTAAESNAELIDMSEALSYAGPVAASAGIGIKDLASVVGVLGNAGIQGSRAGTALRGVLFGLTAPSKEAADTLDRLGITIKKSADGSIDLIDTFHQLADAGIGAGEAQKLFGRYAAAGVLAVTSQIDSLDKMVISNDAAAGAAKKMADVMKDNLQGSFVAMLSAIDGLKRAFGDPLLGPIRAVVKAITSLVTGVTIIVEKFPITAKMFGIVALAAAGLAAALGLVATGIGSINVAMGILAKPAIAGILTKLGVAFFGLSTQVGTAAFAFKSLQFQLSLTPGLFAKVAVAARALGAAMLAAWPLAVAAAIGAVIIALQELEERQNRLASEAGLAADENEALRESYVKQTEALKGMEQGSEKAIATAKSMREQLLETAKSNSELRIEATKAANSINEFTGQVTDGGSALDKFTVKAQELSQWNMDEKLRIINDQLDRQEHKLIDYLYVWKQVKIAADVWWSTLIPGGRKVEDVINDQVEALKKFREESELAERASLKLLEKQGAFDISGSLSETINYYRVVKGYSKERAESVAQTNELMKKEAAEVRDITRTVGDLSLADLKSGLDDSIEKVNELGEAYENASRKSREAAEALDKIPERVRKNSEEEQKLVAETAKAKAKALNELVANEEKINGEIKGLRQQLRADTNKIYDEGIAELKRQKELGYIIEWQYNQKVAELGLKRAESEKKNLIELQNTLLKIRKETGAKLSGADTAAVDTEKANEKIAEAQRKISDEKVKRANEVAKVIVGLEAEAKDTRISLMEESEEKFNAEMDNELSKLKQSLSERGVLWEQAGSLRLAIEAKYAKQIDDFREEEAEKEKKAEEKKAEELAKAAKKKQDLEKSLRGIESGVIDEEDYKRRNELELAALDEKHNIMKERIDLFLQDDLERRQAYDLLNLEREKLQAEQENEIKEQQKEYAIKALDDTFMASSHFLGKQSRLTKEAFALQKAVAIRETIMTTYASAVKAFDSLAKIPIVGTALGTVAAAAAVAAGLAKVAQIRAQTLAGGGEVKGHSPHSKADNVPIWATAKEFVQPVSAVQYYGKDIMEALRKKMIPREALAGLPIATTYTARPKSRYAEGGGVTPRPDGSAASTQPQGMGAIKILNYLDPQEMLEAMGTAQGEEVVMNVISRNSEKVQRVLQ